MVVCLMQLTVFKYDSSANHSFKNDILVKYIIFGQQSKEGLKSNWIGMGKPVHKAFALTNKLYSS